MKTRCGVARLIEKAQQPPSRYWRDESSQIATPRFHIAQVVNTHILCDPAAADVKLWQSHLLIKACRLFAKAHCIELTIRAGPEGVVFILGFPFAYICTIMYSCMCMCVYIYTHIYVYIYIYIYIHVQDVYAIGQEKIVQSPIEIRAIGPMSKPFKQRSTSASKCPGNLTLQPPKKLSASACDSPSKPRRAATCPPWFVASWTAYGE